MVSPPIKYHGGKHYLARRIIALMPPHLHYVEPYFGGGAVLMAKDPEGVSEVANDINGNLARFWGVLRCEMQFPRFARMAQATEFSESVWDEAGHILSPSSGCEDGARLAWAFFVRCRQSLAGRMKSFTGVTKTRTRRGMNNEVSAWLTAVEGLPAVHERLKRVLILNRDALDVIRSQDGKDTLFYGDPPYLHETRATTSDYAHEMTPEQHAALLSTLTDIQGRFILSGYPSQLYDDHAARHGWHHVDISIPNHAAGGKEKRRMTERLWMNYRPEEERK